MLKQRFLAAGIGVATLFTLLFGVGAGAGHSFAATSMMSDMGKRMAQNQCQSSCSSQSTVAAPGQRVDVEDKDIEPQPAEPYYLAFIGVGWTTIVLAAAYLLRHLRWRPPDLYKLNSVYRI